MSDFDDKIERVEKIFTRPTDKDKFVAYRRKMDELVARKEFSETPVVQGVADVLTRKIEDITKDLAFGNPSMDEHERALNFEVRDLCQELLRYFGTEEINRSISNLDSVVDKLLKRS